jgi:mycothiol synthase
MKTETFTMRAARDEDAEAIVAHAAEESALIGVESALTIEDLRVDWSDPEYDHDRCSRLAEVDGSLAGRAGLWLGGVPQDGIAGLNGYVSPRFRGRGIGSALLSWAVESPRSNARARELSTGVDSEHEDAIALVESFGFEHRRSFFRMVNRAPGAIGEPSLPDGVRVTNSLRGDELLDAVVTAHDGSFIDHWNFHPMRRDRLERDFLYPGVSPDLIFVALEGKTVAGYCYCFIEEAGSLRRGWVAQLGTCRSHRKVGLGKALLRHGTRELAARGCTEAVLTVDTENPSGALILYERNGYERQRESRSYWLALR